MALNCLVPSIKFTQGVSLLMPLLLSYGSFFMLCYKKGPVESHIYVEKKIINAKEVTHIGRCAKRRKLMTLTEVIRLFYSGNIAKMYGWARYVLRKSGPFRTRLLSVPSPQHAIARQTIHCIGRNVTKLQSRHKHLHQQNYNVETSEVIIRTWALVYT